jgi:hypothetical protein
MSVFAYMVTKNEADRYLDTCLDWLTPVVDGVAVYDDQSTDATVAICQKHNCEVTVRPDTVPSFLQHESDFRQAAWNFVEQTFSLTENDWVLAIDADEILMDPTQNTGTKVRQAIVAAKDATAIMLKVHEIFGCTEEGVPLVRMDGYWDKIEGTRLFRYQRGGVFSGRRMGSGAEPTYVTKKISRDSLGLYLLHYGYAKQSDQFSKYERYSKIENNGHANTHVESIVRHGTLREFDKPFVRGLC